MGRRNETITGIEGVRVGHAEDYDSLTGCTVLIFETRRWPVVAVEVRGGLPGTYGTAGLDPSATIRSAKAIFLSGGSLDGMDVASGIRRFLMEKTRLRPIFGVKVKPPVGVSGAIVFDLGRRMGHWPDAEMGYEACEKASSSRVKEGNVGTGTGCTVGKLRGIKFSMKGGVGSSCITLPNGLQVGALVAVNAVGNIVDPSSGQIIAGTRSENGGFHEFTELMPILLSRGREVPIGTTVGVVVTNADLSHDEVQKMVQMSHDGLARSIRPSHTATDGDALFGVSTGELRTFLPRRLEREWIGLRKDVVGHLAAEQVTASVIRAVRAAKTIKFDEAWNGMIPGLASG